MTPGKVGVVFVSHSARIAEGLVDLARQMAPSAALVAAGGTDDGAICRARSTKPSAMRAECETKTTPTLPGVTSRSR